MSTPMMESMPVVQAGATGRIADMTRIILAHRKVPFELQAIGVASNEELIGKKLGETSLLVPDGLEDVPLVSLDDLGEVEADIVLSGLQNEKAVEYKTKLAKGRKGEFTNSAANRMDDDVALYNAVTGGGQMDELFSQQRESYVVANGNCVAIPVSEVVAPLYRQIGIDKIGIETLQGWSGDGKSEVPEAHRGAVIPIYGDEKSKIEQETRKFLGTMENPADVDTEAKVRRGPWERGHHAKLKLTMARPTTKEEVMKLLEGIRLPEELREARYGEYSPKRHPVKVSKKKLLLPDKDNLFKPINVRPMTVDVQLRKVSKDGMTVKLSLIADNLILGGPGSSVMNAMCARLLGYI